MNKLTEYIERLRSEGAFNEFSSDHILIKAIKNDDEAIKRFCKWTPCDGFYEPNALSFVSNFSQKMGYLSSVFGHNEIVEFIKVQLSAGKSNYDEKTFIQALSEIEILFFLIRWCGKVLDAQYEPRQNEARNPEAQIKYNDTIVINIEVKTPKFDELTIDDGFNGIIQPNVCLDRSNLDKFKKILSVNKFQINWPKVCKIKDFINSAVGKFNSVDHKTQFNVLCINYSCSPWNDVALDEPEALLLNPSSGILVNEKIRETLEISKRIDNISAFIIYKTNSQSLLFTDIRTCLQRVYLIPNPLCPNLDLEPLQQHLQLRKLEPLPLVSDFSLFSWAMRNNYEFTNAVRMEIEKLLSKNIGIDVISF